MARLSEVTGTYTLPYTVKADRTPYLILLICFTPLILIGAMAFFENASMWPVLLIALATLGCSWFIIGSYRISLLEDKIVFKTLFSKGEMAYREISKVSFGHRDMSIGAVPTLYLFDGTTGRSLSILIKSFSKRDLAIVGDVMTIKAPYAEKEDYIRIVWPR